ncbi:ATP-binding protein [Kineococcus sp. SYSU DK003]|uniref:ATP-binding protein n=1 Tax=Kineococcus sp. SYSU DK003 TaxID=3383124 RepID=UPI003D7DAF6D
MATASLDLPVQLSAVGTTRRWAVDQCREHLTDTARDLLELLASELVANAVVHGTGPLRVQVECAPEHVCVAVFDGSSEPPTVRSVGPEATGGRGVALIARLSSAWGYRMCADGAGKVTWFQLGTAAG